MLVDFFKNLPWYIMYPGKAVAAVVGGYVSQNPQTFPSWAVLLGAAVALWVVLAFLWHALNAWREHRGKARLQLDPQLILILFLVGGLAAAIWQWQRGIPIDPKIAILTAQVDDLKNKLASPQNASPAAVPTQTPIKPSKNYFPAEKKSLGDLYALILDKLNKDGALAAKQAYNFGGDTPSGNKHQLESHLDRITATRGLVSGVYKVIYLDIIPNNPSFNYELSQLFSNSPDNVPVGPFMRELEKYHRDVSIFANRYDGLNEEDRVITAALISRTTSRLLETSQLFQNWIQQCNERIDVQRELLR